MPTNPEGLTLAIALTAGGAVAFAALITGVIQLIKTVARDAVSGHEQLVALILSAVVVILAMASAIQAGALTLGLESGFTGFLAWYGIASIAMKIHDDATGQPNGLGQNL